MANKIHTDENPGSSVEDMRAQKSLLVKQRNKANKEAHGMANSAAKKRALKEVEDMDKSISALSEQILELKESEKQQRRKNN